MSAPNRSDLAMLTKHQRDAKVAIDMIYNASRVPNDQLISALVEIRVHLDRSLNALEAEKPGARA